MAKSNLHRYSIQEAMSIKTGAGGMDYIQATDPDDASSPTVITLGDDTYCAVKALTDIIITCLSTDSDIWDSLVLCPVLEGTTVYGNWTAVTLTNSVEGSATTKAIVHRIGSAD